MSSGNVFQRFFIFFFTLMFPFLIFITMFRYGSGLNSIYGFYDMFNGISLIKDINLAQDIDTLTDTLDSLNTTVTNFNERFEIPQIIISNLNKITTNKTLKAVLSVVILIYSSTTALANGVGWLIDVVCFILDLITLSAVILLDFVPFLVNILTYFVSTFTTNVKGLLGDTFYVASTSFDEHLDWFTSLTN